MCIGGILSCNLNSSLSTLVRFLCWSVCVGATIDLRGGRGIGNGSYRHVSLSHSFVVPLINLICNIITWLKFLDIPT